ncbi:MAG: hypothetical protein FWH01_15770 [Oscillospiraceae bacterium]|nr:hypothetical protein [Oscillospiraceae bacterium]
MQKIGIITINKVLAQSLSIHFNNNPDFGYEPYQLLNPRQAVLDAEVIGIDLAVVDVVDGPLKSAAQLLEFCGQMREKVPGCKMLLLVSQDDKTGQGTAMGAKRRMLIDGYIFSDTSLDYLLAKLSAL